MKPITDQQIAQRQAKARELRAAAARLEEALAGIARAGDESRGPLLRVREKRAALAVAHAEMHVRDTVRRPQNRAAEWEPEQ